MRFKSLVVLAAFGFGTIGLVAQNADQSELVKQLLQRVEELEQKVKIQDRKYEIDQEATAAKAKTAPVVTVGTKGFSLESPDGDFKLRMRSLVQADSRFYFDDGGVPANDGFLIRRARMEFIGSLYDKFEYRIMPEFAGTTPSLLDAWLSWKIDPAFIIQAGKVRLPIGLERFQSRESNLMTEFGYPTSLVPNRDIGANIQGAVLGGKLDYYLGAFNGTPDGGSIVTDADDDKTLAARVFAHPFLTSDIDGLRGLGIGLAGTYGNAEGTPAGYRTVGQQTFFSWRAGVVDDGTVWRLVPQLYYYNGPLGIQAEYAISSQQVKTAAAFDTLDNTAWQVTASYVLTGEDSTFKGVKPKHNVGFGGDPGWGAWQVVARVSELDIDDNAFPLYANPLTAAAKVTSYGGGINWYLNPQVRISLDYNLSQFDGAGKRDEHVLISRFQYRF